jgi:hypothetical protein
VGLTLRWRTTLVIAVTLLVTTGLLLPAAHGVAPVNQVAPTIAGSPTYRQTLSATSGTWDSPGVLTYDYQWLRSGASIAGATDPTYQLQLDDVGAAISVRVTASDGVDQADADSLPTAPVAKATLLSEVAPEITGRPRFGRVISATAGSWSVKPTTLRYQWWRGKRAIASATEQSYRLRLRDFGKRVSVVVTAKREGYRLAEANSDRVRVKHRVPVRRTVTYHVETRGRITSSLARFARQAQQSYDDPRGWRGLGVKFERVKRKGDFTLVLAEAAQVTTFSSACSTTWSCRVGRFVIINQTRWRRASPAWTDYGRSRRDYRHMVVNHETGHWLGRAHLGCPGPGRLAPVMMQQSKGLAGCEANPWPTRSELRLRSGRPAISGPVVPE